MVSLIGRLEDAALLLPVSIAATSSAALTLHLETDAIISIKCAAFKCKQNKRTFLDAVTGQNYLFCYQLMNPKETVEAAEVKTVQNIYTLGGILGAGFIIWHQILVFVTF